MGVEQVVDVERKNAGERHREVGERTEGYDEAFGDSW